MTTEGTTPPKIRLVDGTGATVCVLETARSEDGFQILAHTNDEARTRELLGAVTPPATAKVENIEGAQRALDHIVQEANKRGYTVAAPKTTRINIKGILDSTTRDLLATVEFPDGDSNQHALNVARDLHKRMAGIFANRVQETIESIALAVAGNNHEDAARAAIDGVRDASFWPREASGPFFQALQRIDVEHLKQDDAGHILLARIHFGDLAGQQPQLLADLDRYEALLGPEVDLERLGPLRRIRAVAATKSGKLEVAYAIYQSLLVENDLPPHLRAQALEGLARLEDEDAEQATLLEKAASAFLEAGNRDRAAGILATLAKALGGTQPAVALQQLDRATAFFEHDNLLGRERSASILLTRSHLLLKVGRPDLALKAALDSVELRRGRLGAEPAFAASLYAAIHAARELKDSEHVLELNSELAAVEQRIDDDDSLLRRRILRSQEDPTAEDPIGLLEELQEVGNPEYLYMWHLGRTIGKWKTDDHEALLGHLDEAQRILDTTPNLRGDRELREILSFAYGQVHLERGDHERALEWYRRTLALNAFHRDARQNFISLLFQAKQWPEVTGFLKKQIELMGERPGLSYLYGRALLEGGDPGRAATYLHKASTMTTDERFREVIRPYFERAMSVATSVEPPDPPAKEIDPPVGIKQLESCLAAFSKFIAAEKRKRFWTKAGRTHKWASKPESIAKGELHTYLKAQLGTGVEVFDEIGAGAGRIDIYLRLSDGSRVVIELKMCGGKTYAKSYARGGISQLVHYMENRNTSLGYLIVFDGRSRDFGVDFPDLECSGRHTVMTRVVDVRASVSNDKEPEEG